MPGKPKLSGGLLVMLAAVAGTIISTQWVAALLDYHPALGTPLFVINEIPVYMPKFFYWWYHFGTEAPHEFERASFAAIAATFSSLILLIIYRATESKILSSHGTAVWADAQDLADSGLLENKGVVLGLTKDGRYLRHDGPEHILLAAPTRSGKGVGVIIPTLLTWPGSVLCVDIKGENWGVTAGYRQQLNNKVIKFDPTISDGSSARYNPLEEIRLRTVNEVRDVQNIADMLVDPQGTGELDHWAKTAHALLVGIILHLKYTQQHATLSDVVTFLSDPVKTVGEKLLDIMSTKHAPGQLFKEIYGVDTQLHPVAAQAAREMTNKAEEERSGVVSTAVALLGLYRDPVVALNTSLSDFTIDDLMNNERPVSLYLVVPPSDISRTRPLVRMLLNQILRKLTETLKFKDGKPVIQYKHRLLLVLDEFPALGRLDTFEAALSFIAGYGLKSLTVIQSLNQLSKTYTQHNSIIDNHHIRIVFTPNEPNTADFISKMLGQKTELVENRTLSGGRFSLWFNHVTVATQETSRPLMTPGEVSQLPKDEEIIFIAGVPPILARKLFYPGDLNFTRRLKEAPDRSDVISPNTETRKQNERQAESS